MAVGREFHSGMVQGKKLFLKVSEEVEICISFIEWCALVLVEAGVTKSAAGISTKPWVILYIMVTCDLALLVMPPTLKKLMGHIAFGACVSGCVGAWVRGSHFLYLL